MARPLRIDFPGAWHHVMNRGQQHRIIYKDDKDKTFFLDLMGETSDLYGIDVHAYALMDNHYHLLIHTPTGELSRAMRHLNSVYTQAFNKRWRRDGPLFRGRYKSLLVDEGRLAELVEYIHLNPVTAGLAATAGDYLWSSHQDYLHPKQAPEWLKTETILRIFGKPDESYKSRRRKSRLSAPTLRPDFSQVSFGRRGFADWLYKNHVSNKQTSDHEHSRKSRHPAPRISPKMILQIVALACDTTIVALLKSTRTRRFDRSLAMHFLRRLGGLTQRQIAEQLNMASPYAVAKALHRFDDFRARDDSLAMLEATIRQNILSHVKI